MTPEERADDIQSRYPMQVPKKFIAQAIADAVVEEREA